MKLFQNVGEIADAASGLFKNELGDQYEIMRAHYSESKNDGPLGFVDKQGGVPGSYSLFNPFRIFRYSGFGKTVGDYQHNLHLDSSGTPLNLGGGIGGLINKIGANAAGDEADLIGAASNLLKSFTEVKKTMENPTASDIIRWSHRGEAMSPVPYSPQDFLWCKYYGKVPNNRMVTLRRYAMPVEDDIRINENKGPAIPIAQAVSWYGADIDNPLSNIINMSWGLKWEERKSKVQDISGNEISIDDIVKAAGLDGPENDKLVHILKTQVFAGNGTQDILKLSGYDVAIQDYIKAAYGDDGPYWNRILGPINAIDRTLIRSRGFGDQPDVVLNFEYSLRSYGGINPKIAFLDLLGNILSLTYNTAPFWGGGARYFQTTGVTTPNLAMENEMLNNNVGGAITAGLEQLANQANANLDELVNFAKDIAKGKYGDINESGTTQLIQDKRKELDRQFKAGPVEKLVSGRIGELMRKPLIYRAILDGRAVGEWHLTVGNPMNPIAMIGNLCLSDVDMTIGETLGIDDFPTEFKFKITLKHGRPRAKQDIESMFNLGKGGMTFSQLAPPSSASNSYGDSNTRKQNAMYEGIDITSPEATRGDTSGRRGKTIFKGGSSKGDKVKHSSKGETTDGKPTGTTIEQVVARYSRQVGNMYGGFYANSPILTDYFKELKTKD